MIRFSTFGPHIDKSDMKFVKDAMQPKSWYVNPYKYCEKFEKIFAKYHDRKFALMTPNCTLAIHLFLLSLNLKRDDEVIVSESTWIATASPVLQTKAKLVLCDVDENTWCLSINQLRKIVTKKTKVIISTSVFGNMPNYRELEIFCKKRKIFLLEDAAESLGSTYNGKKSGKFGIASVFSFHRTKTLTTGEGGMMITSDKKLYERCKFLRDQGRDPFFTYQISELGFKYMPFNLQAALGYSQFLQVDKIVMQKRKIYHWYKKFFHNYDVKLNTDNEDVYNGCWATTLIIGDKYKINAKLLMNYLKSKDLPVRPFFCPLSKMKPFRQNNNNINAAYLYKNGMTLPSALNLKKKEVQFYSECIKNFLDNHNK